MAFKLTKNELARCDDYLTDLNKAWGTLEDAVRVYNEALGTAKLDLEVALAVYNGVLEGLEGWRDDLAARLDGEYDEKSEKWQEGDRAQEVRSWIDEIENIDLEALEVEIPNDLDIEKPEHIEALENLNPEVEYA